MLERARAGEAHGPHAGEGARREEHDGDIVGACGRRAGSGHETGDIAGMQRDTVARAIFDSSTVNPQQPG